MTTPMQRDLLTRRWRKVGPVPQRESAFHIQLVAMLRWCLRDDVIMRHVPNGEHRDPRTAAKLKAMGVLPGSADLEFHWRGPEVWEGELRNLRTYKRKVLFLELKVEKRKMSEAQAGFALAMKLLGDEYHVVRSIDHAIEILGTRGLLRPDVEVCGRRW